MRCLLPRQNSNKRPSTRSTNDTVWSVYHSYHIAKELTIQLNCSQNRPAIVIMAPTRYQYTPLSSDFAFRLLRLKKHARSDSSIETLEIELFKASSRQSSSVRSCALRVGSCRFACSSDLERPTITHVSSGVDMISALSRISTIGIFWVDAVCIDQSSVLKKNIQVPCIRNVFSEAFNV